MPDKVPNPARRAAARLGAVRRWRPEDEAAAAEARRALLIENAAVRIAEAEAYIEEAKGEMQS